MPRQRKLVWTDKNTKQQISSCMDCLYHTFFTSGKQFCRAEDHLREIIPQKQSHELPLKLPAVDKKCPFIPVNRFKNKKASEKCKQKFGKKCLGRV